jgi:hypothetical protein
MTHYLKTLSEYFEDVLSGKKSFEVRKDDRNPKFSPGDKLILQEYMKTEESGVYTGRVIHADVLLVLRGEYCRDGYCIMSIIPTYAINARFEAVTEIGRLKQDIVMLQKALEMMYLDTKGYNPHGIDCPEFYVKRAKEDLQK